MNKAIEFFTATILLTAFMTGPAFAYLDGGSVSMALQVAVGAVASVLVVAKVYFARIVGIFRRLRLPLRATQADSDSN